jgi:mRNA interferase HigB
LHTYWERITFSMRVIARKTLREFWARHAEVEAPLLAWFREVEGADWQGPRDVKARYQSASFLVGNRVVFNIKGNRYRLVVRVDYAFHLVFIRFIGAHAEYDRIDAGET